MKLNLSLPVILLSLIAAFTVFGQNSEQAASSKNEEYLKAKQKIFEIAQAKHQNAPFTLLTPDDLKILSSAELNILQSPQGPCDTAVLINSGQTVNGQLTSADCLLEDGSYADIYAFSGNQGDQATITMNSSVFDTYLALIDENGSFDVEDDDGGGGTNSKIVTTLPTSGYYIIFANSAYPATFGSYTLSLTVGTACTYFLSPTNTTVRAEGGNFSLTVNTQPGCAWTVTYSNGSGWITVNNLNGTGTGTISGSAAANTTGAARAGTFRVNSEFFYVYQPVRDCDYSISPPSVSLPASASTGSFTVNVQSGCVWRAGSSNLDYISFDKISDQTGTGTVNYSIKTNYGSSRTAKIDLNLDNNLAFTINQTGYNCTYTPSQTSLTFDRREHTGTIFVTTNPQCTWNAESINWVNIDPVTKTGSGSFTFRIPANNTSARRSQTAAYTSSGDKYLIVNFAQTATYFDSSPDFDGDGKANLSVYRPSSNYWYLSQPDGTFNGVSLGGANDKPVPADYDGDGKTDLAVYNAGNWTIIRSSTNQSYAVGFGAAEDIPVPADFDGDGKADISVYRPSNGVWYRLNSSTGAFVANGWGTSGDKPAIGDFDGDGKADLAVYRPSNGIWYIVNSSTNQYTIVGFGAAEDLITPGDYDGDGKTDIAVYRPSNNVWYRLNSSTGAFAAVGWGAGSDKPVPADYDGDGRTDIAVYRSGTWYIVRSSDSQIGFGYFGNDTDIPLSNVYVR